MRRIILFTKIVPLLAALLLSLSAQPVYSQKYKKNKSGYPEFTWWRITYPNGNVGLSVNEKKNIVVNDSRGYSSVEFFGSGLFSVKKGDYEGVVNMRGVEVISPDVYNYIESKYNTSCGYKYLQVGIGGSWYSPEKVGALSVDGKVLLPCEYKRIDISSEYISVNYSGKSIPYFRAYNDEKIVVCDADGTILFATSVHKYVYPHFTENPTTYDIGSNVIAYEVYDGSKYGVCDKDGNLLLALEYDDVLSVDDTHGRLLASVKKNNKVGVVDMNGNEIVPPLYDYVHFYKSNDLKYFQVECNNKRGVCDENGVEIIPPMYDGIAYNNGEFRNFVNGKYAEVIDVTRYANPEENITPYNDKWVLSHKGKIFSMHPYDELVWVKEKNRYYGSLDGYSTYIDLTGKEENSIAARVFNKAYAMSSAGFQEKKSAYIRVMEIDVNNKEGYKAVALNNIGVMYAEAGDENTALAYYDTAAQLGNSYGRDNAKSIRDARAAAERAERMQRVNNALTQISNSLSSMSAVMQQNSGSGNVNSYNSNSSGSSSGAGGSSSTKVEKHCTKCAGWGECAKCGGDGYVLGKFSQEFEPCSSCNYKDRAPKSKKGKCTYCGGTGKR